MHALFGLGFTVSSTAARADSRDQARVEPVDVPGISDDLDVEAILNDAGTWFVCPWFYFLLSLLTHFFVSATVAQEQLQPSDPNHPEYGLKPAATPDAVDGNKTTAVGTGTAPSSVRMDSGSHGTNSAAVPEALDGNKAIDSADDKTVVGTGAAAPSVCT
jgi:hypothetical protein